MSKNPLKGYGEFDLMMRAIGGQESNNNYRAQNKRTKAYGKYQIMPSNWKAWTKEFGMEGADPTPENQEKIARNKLWQYYKKYGARGAIQSWYAGEGSLKYSDYALNRKQGKGDEPSINEYVDSVMKRMGVAGTTSLTGTVMYDAMKDTWDDFRNDIISTPQVDAVDEEKDTLDIFFDSASNAFWDSPLVTAGAEVWTQFKYAGADRGLMESEINVINDILKDDPTYAKYVTNSGFNADVAMDLAYRKATLNKEQRDMEQYCDGVINAVNVGRFIGEGFADPTMLLPAGFMAGRALNLARVFRGLGGVLPNNIPLVNRTINMITEAEMGMVANNLLDEHFKGNEKTTEDYVNDAGITALSVLTLNGLARALPSVANTSYGQRISNIIQQAQTNLMTSVGLGRVQNVGTPNNIFERLTRMVDQGYYGALSYSQNPLVREITAVAVKDARQRDHTPLGYNGIAMEEMKRDIFTQLKVPYREYLALEADWLRTNYPSRQWGIHSQSQANEFHRLVIQEYNRRYAGHQPDPNYTPDAQVDRAVNLLHSLRQRQIELGKQHGSVDQDWDAVDHEFHRVINDRRRHDFIDRCGGVDNAIDRVERYLHLATNNPHSINIMRQKMIRARERENRVRQNQGLPSLPLQFTDDEVRDYIEELIPRTARAWIRDNYDVQNPTHYLQNDAVVNVGNLQPFGLRLSFDTSIRYDVDGEMFSFDDVLREWNANVILERNYNRFAGETAFLQRFPDQASFDSWLRNVDTQYRDLVSAGQMTRADVRTERQHLINMLNEIRGMRGQDEAYSKARGVVGILKKVTYGTRGLKMGFNQLGELGGVMTYGGMHQLFRVFPYVWRNLDELHYGRNASENLERASSQLIASDRAEDIFRENREYRLVEDVVSTEVFWDRRARQAGDIANYLSKVTARLSGDRWLTDQMMMGLRKDALWQCMQRADGRHNSRNDYMFSEDWLRTIGITDTQSFLDDIRRYIVRGSNNEIVDLDIERWRRENYDSYSKLYTFITRHCEKAMVTTESIGSRNLLKDSHWALQLVFQFKDFTLRAVNGQTLRGLTSRQARDATASIASTLTTIMAHGYRLSIPYLIYKAVGNEDEAEEYYSKNLSWDKIMKEGTIRSPMIGTPFSIWNDIKEIATGEGTTSRSTVHRKKASDYDDTKHPLTNILDRGVEQVPAFGVLDNTGRFALQGIEKGKDGLTVKETEELLDLVAYSDYPPIALMIEFFLQRFRMN